MAFQRTVDLALLHVHVLPVQRHHLSGTHPGGQRHHEERIERVTLGSCQEHIALLPGPDVAPGHDRAGSLQVARRVDSNETPPPRCLQRSARDDVDVVQAARA
jgi:hypothetical protein